MHLQLMLRSISGRAGKVWNWLNEGAHGEAFRITLLCSAAGTIGGAYTGLGALFGFLLGFGICAVMFSIIAILLAIGNFINTRL